jgi:hypothetical protein
MTTMATRICEIVTSRFCSSFSACCVSAVAADNFLAVVLLCEVVAALCPVSVALQGRDSPIIKHHS